MGIMKMLWKRAIEDISQQFCDGAAQFLGMYSEFIKFCSKHGMTEENATRFANDILNDVHRRYSKINALKKEGKTEDEIRELIGDGECVTVDLGKYWDE